MQFALHCIALHCIISTLLSVSLNSINVKTAESIGPTFLWQLKMTTGKVNGLSKLNVDRKNVDIFNLKMHQFKHFVLESDEKRAT